MPDENSEQRLVVLVDVQNIYYTTRQSYQRNFDYNKFWRSVNKDRVLVKAIAYATDRGDEKQRQFQNILRAIGFEVKLKPLISRSDGSAKGDWDVGITIDALEYAPEADVMILASGDGDFELLVNKIRAAHAVSVEVFGVPEFTARALMNAASVYTPIDEQWLLGSAR